MKTRTRELSCVTAVVLGITLWIYLASSVKASSDLNTLFLHMLDSAVTVEVKAVQTAIAT